MPNAKHGKRWFSQSDIFPSLGFRKYFKSMIFLKCLSCSNGILYLWNLKSIQIWENHGRIEWFVFLRKIEKGMSNIAWFLFSKRLFLSKYYKLLLSAFDLAWDFNEYILISNCFWPNNNPDNSRFQKILLIVMAIDYILITHNKIKVNEDCVKLY
jgi:hypothetical protein